MSFNGWNILFFFTAFQIAPTFAQSSSPSEILAQISGFKIEKQEIKTKDGKILSWGRADFPHLNQKFNRQGQLVEEREYFLNSKKLQSVHKYFIEAHSSEKTFYSEATQKPIRIQKSELKGQQVYTTIRDLVTGTSRLLVGDQYEQESQNTDEPCLPSARAFSQVRSLKAFTRLFSALQVQGTKGDYLKTSMGILVDPSCTQKNENFLFKIQDSITTGLACLKELNTPKAEIMLSKMASILDNQQNPLKIRCNETSGYDWSGTIAHASTTPDQKDHPFISINPEKVNDPDLKATLFHEFFHNCGYRHNVDPEVVSTCESCCMKRKKNYKFEFEAKSIRLACELCDGNYSDVTSIDYLRKFTDWAKNSFSIRPEKTLISQITTDQTPSKEKFQLLLENFGTFNLAYGTLNDTLFKKLSRSKQSLLPKDFPTQSKSLPGLRPSTKEFVDALVIMSKGNKKSAFEKILRAWENLPTQAPPNLNEADKKEFVSQAEALSSLYQNFARDVALSGPGTEMFTKYERVKQGRGSSYR